MEKEKNINPSVCRSEIEISPLSIVDSEWACLINSLTADLPASAENINSSQRLYLKKKKKERKQIVLRAFRIIFLGSFSISV